MRTYLEVCEKCTQYLVYEKNWKCTQKCILYYLYLYTSIYTTLSIKYTSRLYTSHMHTSTSTYYILISCFLSAFDIVRAQNLKTFMLTFDSGDYFCRKSLLTTAYRLRPEIPVISSTFFFLPWFGCLYASLCNCQLSFTFVARTNCFLMRQMQVAYCATVQCTPHGYSGESVKIQNAHQPIISFWRQGQGCFFSSSNLSPATNCRAASLVFPFFNILKNLLL